MRMVPGRDLSSAVQKGRVANEIGLSFTGEHPPTILSSPLSSILCVDTYNKLRLGRVFWQ